VLGDWGYWVLGDWGYWVLGEYEEVAGDYEIL
jgi:hypothetical protein